MTRVYLVRHCMASGQAADRALTADGEAQAVELATFLARLGIERIVSSPYKRAVRSIAPLAERLALPVETDARLAERVLSSEPLDNWEARMRASYEDVDTALPGGETTTEALTRGAAAMDDLLRGAVETTVAVSHGNLLSLLLGHYGFHGGGNAGYETWRAMTNPDVFCLERHARRGGGTRIERIWSGV